MQSIRSLGPSVAFDAPTPQGSRSASSPDAAATAGKGSKPATAAQIKAAVDAANKVLDQSNQGFSFEFDDTLNGMSVKIIDKRTNTVVRLVPSQQMLRAAHALTDTPTRGALLKSEA